MEKLWYDIGEVLGVTILHSLWQGLIIYCLVRLALICFPAASSARKYQLLFISLVGLTFWFGCTFFNEAKNYDWLAPQVVHYTPAQPRQALAQNFPAQAQPVTPTFRDNATQFIKTWLPYLSAIYIVILLINIVRFAVGWQKISGVKNNIGYDDAWQEKVNHFAGQLAIAKYVQLGLSKAVDGPCTVGYLKPVILLPIAFTTQLSTQEVEAILLHELAHIKNNDYLYNIIQQMMVVVLFLNPFALLISRMIGRERENRCDDVVVEMTENPLPYAHALVKLEEIRYSNMQLALAATGQKYHLLARVERIIKRKKPLINVKHLLAILMLFVFSVGSLAWLNPEIKDGQLTSKHGAQAVKQLVAIIKKVIEPVKSAEIMVVQPKPNKKTVSVIDSINKTVDDTAKLTPSQRTALIDEYKQIAREEVTDRNKLERLPELVQVRRLQKTLDSIRDIKVKEALTPELKQESKDNSEAWRNFENTPEYKKQRAEYQRLVQKFLKMMHSEPEYVQWDNDYSRRKDSLKKELTQTKGLTEKQLWDNSEWQHLQQEFTANENALTLELMNRPKIRIVYDSLESASHAMYSSPEFEALNKKTHASPAMMSALTPAGLEEYKAALKEAGEKLSQTALSKKYNAEIKRHDEIVEKLNKKP